MASLSAFSAQEALAALRLHQEWGVDALMEDMPWDVWEERPAMPVRVRPRGQARQAGGQEGHESGRAAPGGERPSGRGGAHRTAKSMEEVQAALARAGDVADLTQASREIPGITLARTAKHHLAPVLVEGSPFLLVGDVPNEDEDRHGHLFAGMAGELLTRILASIGLERAALSMASAIPWRPPGGQRVSQRELELCLPVLHRTISLARPVRIVTMGTTPAWMLLQQSARLSQLRGRWHEVSVPGMSDPVPLLPLWHPAQLGENAGRRKHLWSDLLLLAETLAADRA